MSAVRSTWLRIVLIAAGVAALVWFIREVDWPETGRLLARLGPWAPLVFVPYLVVYLVDTAGWRLCFPDPHGVRFLRFFRIRWAGEAVNNVIPSGAIGGEAVKVLLLRRHGLPGEEGTAAAVVSKTAQTLAQLAYLVASAVIWLNLGDAPAPFRWAMLGVLAGVTLALALAFWVQRRGVMATAAGLVGWMGRFGERLRARLVGLRRLDDRIGGFYRRHPARFRAAVAVYLAGWLLDTIELFAIAWLLDLPLTWFQALAIESCTSVVKVAAVAVPGALGVQESGIVLLCRLAGAPPQLAFAYAIIRRAREALFALIGWKFLLTERVRLRDLRAGRTAPAE
ncbi:MAG: flippase-like domain-containing protein [Limisphaerales bacterium]